MADQLQTMIDIHAHILPGVDDGAQTTEEALEMARQAVAGGTAMQFATPHVSSQSDLEHAGRIAEDVTALRQRLDEAGIPLTLVAGAEVFPMDGVPDALAAGAPITLGPAGKYLLLDLPFAALPMGLGQLVYKVQLRGVTPILAHPERVAPVQQNPQVLEELVQRGVLLQITTTSLLGLHGEGPRETARIILEHRWAHFLASDAHSPRRRCPGQAQAAAMLTELMDEAEAEDLVRNNGQRVLEGAPVPTQPRNYVPRKKTHWWSFLARGR